MLPCQRGTGFSKGKIQADIVTVLDDVLCLEIPHGNRSEEIKEKPITLLLGMAVVWLSCGKVLTFFWVTVGVAEEESSEDLLKTGHLTQLLEADLTAEVESLCVGDVVGGLERLLTHVRSLCDSCEPVQLQVPATAALHDTCCTSHALCLSL